ncbi:uncharacterized protein METZ01_LOCUS360550, partial [marine metagenome]
VLARAVKSSMLIMGVTVDSGRGL